MYMTTPNRATIALKKETRKKLIEIGKKNQSYDLVIKDLIISKKKLDLLEGKTSNLHLPSEIANP